LGIESRQTFFTNTWQCAQQRSDANSHRDASNAKLLELEFGLLQLRPVSQCCDQRLAARPENDGVPNLLKYVFDINPSVPMTLPNRAALPVVRLDTNTHPGVTYLTLTYNLYALLTGVTVNVQTSTTMQPGSWTTLNNSSVPNMGTTSGGDLIMRAEVPVTTSLQFMRVNVTQP
jgi:hypothetical protein